MSETVCNAEKLTCELQEANLPVAGVSSTGRVDYSRELTKSERTLAEQLISNHDPAPLADEIRMEAYKSAGITSDLMVQALWNEMKNGDPEDADFIQSIMDAIDGSIQ